ncbi:hypothetical protein MGYG_09213, partial [Nannizzia gypsea CBS 118893]
GLLILKARKNKYLRTILGAYKATLYYYNRVRNLILIRRRKLRGVFTTILYLNLYTPYMNLITSRNFRILEASYNRVYKRQEYRRNLSSLDIRVKEGLEAKRKV